MIIDGIEIKWLGHSGFLIKNPAPQAYTKEAQEPLRGPNKSSTKIFTKGMIYIDPYNIKDDSEKADLILLTHSHHDHCSVVDIKKIIKEGTRIVLTADCQSKIVRFDTPIKIDVVEPGQEITFGSIKISVLPAYNVDKHFHPKDESWVGYFLKINGLLIYHAGDTDVIPEMQKLTGYKQQGKKLIVLLPVGGRFTMSVEEAVEAAKLIKPDLAIPMHYGSLVGTEEDAKEFKELCEEERINCEILEKE